MKGQLFLYLDMKLIVKHKYNINITGSHRENLRQSLIDCPFPSREFHKKLGYLADCSFKSGNLGEIGGTKNVYK